MHSPTLFGSPATLSARFWIYQRERFPLATYVPLIGVFTFSAAAFSRVARGAPGFVPLGLFAIGAATALVFFFLLRVLDEHKDAAIDRARRPELPVPRGLISLAELRWIAGAALGGVVATNAVVAPRLLLLFVPIVAWAALMTREFFVAEWLRAQPALYLVSHMAIMPLIDGYTTGLDWAAAGAPPSRALVYFLIVTFLNGVVIEIGRKLRAPHDERPGVDTYSSAWGARRAAHVWLAALVATAATAAVAAQYVGGGALAVALLVVAAVVAGRPALRFARTPTAALARRVEQLSGAWTIVMYLLLGAGPFVGRALG